MMNFTDEHKPSETVLIEINMNGIAFSINGLVIKINKLEELMSAILKKQVELMT